MTERGLLDRFGARLPLVVGPAVAALGLALLALSPGGWPYWAAFLLSIAVLGLGMAVAPITTSVINAVPTHQAGVASGVNTAVASVASLLAVALFGAIALNDFNRALDHRLTTQTVSFEVKRAVEGARGKFVIEPALAAVQGDDRRVTESIVRNALAESIRLAMLLAAALALAGAVCAALTIAPAPRIASRRRLIGRHGREGASRRSIPRSAAHSSTRAPFATGRRPDPSRPPCRRT
jgi:MFS family permease